MLKKSQNIIITIVILLSIPIITMGVASIYSDGANLKTIATQFLIDGIVGINTTGPDRKLDILDASNPQLRLTHTDGSVYVDMQGTSDGHLSISGSGGNVGIATTTPNQKLTVVGNISGTGELAIDGAVSFGSTLSVTATSTQATTTMTQAEANQLTVAGLTTLFSSITTVSTTTQLCLAGDDCILTWGDVAGSADIDTANVTSTNSLVATGYTILNTLVVDGLSALTTMTVTDATSTNFDVSTQLHLVMRV